MQVADFYVNYSSVGDIATIAICVINWFLLYSTYAEKRNDLKIYNLINALCIGSAVCSILFYTILQRPFEGYTVWAYITGKTMYSLQLLLYAFLVYYLANIANITGRQRKRINSFIFGGYAVYFVLQMTSFKTHLGFYFDENNVLHQNYFKSVHFYAYIVYTIIAVSIIKIKSNHFVTKIRRCLEKVVLLSYIIMVLQFPFNQTSFTCITYTFPIIAGLYLFHYNSYDLETGTLDKKSFLAYLRDMKKRKFALVCMHLREAPERKIREMSQYFFHFNEQFFNETATFRISNTTMILVYPIDKNPNHKDEYPELLRQFNELYEKYRMEYKLSFISSDPRIKDGEHYLELAMNMESRMEWDSVRWCSDEDIEKYVRMDMVRAVLHDIFEQNNLDDERVKVYCQPVLNCLLNRFTTAEALMRMEIPNIGMLFPDEFIPIAEKNDYIHTLSKIILNKTCRSIVDLQKKGYDIERVSVNFSMVELRDENFCDDILSIINNTGVEPSKIAIELTESRNEHDRELVIRVMDRLQKCGIKFYLDDFGTGYSNFEKIMGLPIDIVKFDRSLTIMSGKDEQSKFMVDRFADIFANSGYQILFEGVEDEQDEKRCTAMKAEYLQGYKYSKPIPIEELEGFLVTKN